MYIILPKKATPFHKRRCKVTHFLQKCAIFVIKRLLTSISLYYICLTLLLFLYTRIQKQVVIHLGCIHEDYFINVTCTMVPPVIVCT